jgi:hypothetical protein
LEEVPSLTKTTAKKERKMNFPSHAPTAKRKFRRSFTRSSAHKEVVEVEVIPKASVAKKVKGKGEAIEKPIEVISKASVQ